MFQSFVVGDVKPSPLISLVAFVFEFQTQGFWAQLGAHLPRQNQWVDMIHQLTYVSIHSHIINNNQQVMDNVVFGDNTIYV